MEIVITVGDDPQDVERWRQSLYYLSRFGAFSDIQDACPLPMNELEHR